MEQESSEIRIDGIYRPAEAYDLAASRYDGWHWQDFWRQTETPFFDDCVESHDFIVRGRMLDAGCGTGFHLDRYGPLFDEAFGIDPSIGMLDQAALRAGDAHLAVGGLTPLPYASGMFDLVVCARVLSHVPDIVAALSELARVTAPGGLLLISNICEEHPYGLTRLPSDMGDIYADTFKHSRRRILQLITEAGLTVSSTIVISASGPTFFQEERFDERASDPVAWGLAVSVPE